MKNITSIEILNAYLNKLEKEIAGKYVFGENIISKIRADLNSGKLILHDRTIKK